MPDDAGFIVRTLLKSGLFRGGSENEGKSHARLPFGDITVHSEFP